jgi:hypothetical protein
LIGLLVTTIDVGEPRPVSNAERILLELDQSFDVNDLLRIAITRKAIVAVLTWLSQLLNSDRVRLTDDSLCISILKYIFQAQVSEVPAVAGAVVRINTLNHSSVRTFWAGLSARDKQKFESSFGRFLPDFPFRGVNIDVPHFDPKAAATFRRRISELCQSTTDGQWRSIRSEVYTGLSQSLLVAGNEKCSLGLLFRLVNEKGTSEYHKFLPGLLAQVKGPGHQLVDDILLQLLTDIKPRDLVAEAQQHVLAPAFAVGMGALEVVTRMIPAMEPEDVVALLAGIFPILRKALQNEAPEMRKAAVICLVEMKAKLLADVEPFLLKLSKAQQKLVAVYYARRVS